MSTRRALGGADTVTVASVIMNLAARRMRVAFGRPCVTPYAEVQLPVAAA